MNHFYGLPFSMKCFPSAEVKKEKHLVIFLLVGENSPLQL